MQGVKKLFSRKKEKKNKDKKKNTAKEKPMEEFQPPVFKFCKPKQPTKPASPSKIQGAASLELLEGEKPNIKTPMSVIPQRRPFSTSCENIWEEVNLPRTRKPVADIDSPDSEEEDIKVAPNASTFDITQTGLYKLLNRRKNLRRERVVDFSLLSPEEASKTTETPKPSGPTDLREVTIPQIVGEAPIRLVQVPLIPRIKVRRPSVDVPVRVPPPLSPRHHRPAGLKPRTPTTPTSGSCSGQNTPASLSPISQNNNNEKRPRYKFEAVLKERFPEGLQGRSSSSSSASISDIFVANETRQ